MLSPLFILLYLLVKTVMILFDFCSTANWARASLSSVTKKEAALGDVQLVFKDKPATF